MSTQSTSINLMVTKVVHIEATLQRISESERFSLCLLIKSKACQNVVFILITALIPYKYGIIIY